MGYLEGYITYKRIYDHYRNNNNYKFYKTNGIMPEYLEKFFIQNLQFIKKMCSLYSNTDPYFHEVNNFFNQMHGILDGYNQRVLIEDDQFKSNYSTTFYGYNISRRYRRIRIFRKIAKT